MCGIVRILLFFGSVGYVLVHFNKMISSQPFSRIVLTVSSISATVAIPVDTIIGLPVEATLFINGI